MVDQSRFEVRLNRAAGGTLQARFEPAENLGAASALPAMDRLILIEWLVDNG